MVDVVLITKASPSKDLKDFEKTVLDSLAELGKDVSLTSKSSAAANVQCGKDFTIYVGYDYKILAHFFSKLDQDSFFIFLGAAGESCEGPLSKVLENCSDYMDCDPVAYRKMAHIWSYKEAISYVKQRIKAKSTSAAAEAPAAVA